MNDEAINTKEKREVFLTKEQHTVKSSRSLVVWKRERDTGEYLREDFSDQSRLQDT